jgi:hypothetical protein
MQPSGSNASTTTPGVSTSTQVVSTTTTAPVETTTTVTSPPPPTTTTTPVIPKVYLTVTLLNTSKITTQSQLVKFRMDFAAALSISADFLTVSFGATSSSVNVVITAYNASAIATEAVNLPSSVLATFGAAAVKETSAPTANPNPLPEKKKDNIAAIAGGVAAGVVVLLILLYIAKKKSSGGTGNRNTITFQQSGDGTGFRKMEDEMKTRREAATV